MADNHPFTIKIEPHPEGVRRSRWSIYEGGRLRDHSPESYATMREAKANADKVMQKLITNWQIIVTGPPNARET
jgi:hypothetical protein